jgi:hypothetical protein
LMVQRKLKPCAGSIRQSLCWAWWGGNWMHGSEN